MAMGRKVMTRLWCLLSLFLFTAWIVWQTVEYHSQDSRDSHRLGLGTVPEYSFLASLHGFLVKHADKNSISGGNSPAVADEEGERFSRFLVEAERPTLLVYVYEMPAKFTTDLLWLFHDSLEQTANLTSNGSPVHRLIEQHSVDFWLFSDLMEPEENRLVRSVRRVSNPAQADVFYIPFFTTIPFFLLSRAQSRLLYREAVKWITGQTAWKRSGGRDHVLAVHHPWSIKSHRRFLKPAIWLLPDLDSSGNWYKEGEVSLEKDVVMPYVANVEACDSKCLATSKLLRKTLLFFRGRIVRGSGGRIRAQLAAVLRDEKEGIVIQEGSSGEEGKAATQCGMRRSVFCLSPAGDTPSSARLFDAVVSGCIPVVVSDELELPFEGLLDYQQIALFVPAAQAVQKGWLVAHLRNKTSQDIAAMQHHLAQVLLVTCLMSPAFGIYLQNTASQPQDFVYNPVKGLLNWKASVIFVKLLAPCKFARHLRYATPAQPLGPEDLMWRMVAGKLQSVRLHIHRSHRLVQGALNTCSCQCTRAASSGSHL